MLLNLQPSELLPSYDGGGLANLPATICTSLGVPPDGLCPPLSDATTDLSLLSDSRTLVLVVADGLGRAQLDAGVEQGLLPRLAGLLERGSTASASVRLDRLRTVFPSSTIPALASLFSGLAPSVHALLGWTLFARELNRVVEVARWGPAGEHRPFADGEALGLTPSAFFGQQTLSSRLAREGVSCHVIGPREYRDSGLTRMIHQGATYHSYENLPEAFIALSRLLEELRGKRAFVALYWPRLDQVTHESGPSSGRAAEELRALDAALGGWLRDARGEDLALLLTADHGHVETPCERAIVFNHCRELEQLLAAPPAGERRCLYFHAREGRRQDARQLLETMVGEAAAVFETEDLFDANLFGPDAPSPPARQRAGDLLVLARGNSQVIYSHEAPPKPHPTLGNHGALDRREVEVPLLVWRR